MTLGLPRDVPYVGVDGCPAGWFAAGVDRADEWHFEQFGEFRDLWEHLHVDGVQQILVDVPIGLLEDSVRACDEAARDMLGCRWNSVFRTPVKEAIELKRDEEPGEDRHSDASARNDARVGHGITIQAWNITGKIAALDSFFEDADLSLDGAVREAHPELAFMAFNGQPVAYSKGSTRGHEHRLWLLESRGDGAMAAANRAKNALARSEVRNDDVVDAMALALAARDDLESVPEAPRESQPRIYYPSWQPVWADQSYFSG